MHINFRFIMILLLWRRTVISTYVETLNFSASSDSPTPFASLGHSDYNGNNKQSAKEGHRGTFESNIDHMQNTTTDVSHHTAPRKYMSSKCT